jgi:cytochrome c oxidase cbb3-type subunit 4
VDEGTVRGVIAVVTLATFLGICWWAYRGANAQRFEEAGRLPFEEEAGAAESDALRRGGRS